MRRQFAKPSVLPEASGDLGRLHELLASKNPNDANRTLDSVKTAMMSLKELLAKRSPLSNGVRELLVPFGKAAYVVRYKIRKAEKQVAVVRVWHARERRS